MPAGAETTHVIHHGAGYSLFESQSHGLRQDLRLFAAPDAPVKIAHLRLQNVWNPRAGSPSPIMLNGYSENAGHAASPYHAGV